VSLRLGVRGLVAGDVPGVFFADPDHARDEDFAVDTRDLLEVGKVVTGGIGDPCRPLVDLPVVTFFHHVIGIGTQPRQALIGPHVSDDQDVMEAAVVDVAVLEPREVFRCGLATMLARLDWVSRLECHRSMDELLVTRNLHGSEWNPDIVIVRCCHSDYVTDLVQDRFPTSRVLELIASAEPGDLAMVTKARADGYLMLHEITEATLDGALRALMRGELPMPPPVANYLLERVRSTEASPSRIQPYFSPRERDVIALLLKGLSNRQIAQRLRISQHSVKRHVSAVLHKVNSPSRAHFVARMLRDD